MMSGGYLLLTMIWFILLPLMDIVTCAPPDILDYCPSLKPQKLLEIKELMGIWHAIQIIHHKHDENRDHGYELIDDCPLLHLSRLSDSDLKLVWDEKAGIVEYRFRMTDPSSPGLWISSGQQNGSLSSHHSYTHFTGTAQVMKAVNTHVVLTFCSQQPVKLFYSVLMSRTPKLDRSVIRSIHNMLEVRGLRSHGTREVCRNGASIATSTVISHLIFSVILSSAFVHTVVTV